MPFDASELYDGFSPIRASHVKQFFDWATGIMTDQAALLRNNLTVQGTLLASGVHKSDVPLDGKHEAAAPAAPGAGYTRLYPKVGGLYYREGAAGAETFLATADRLAQVNQLVNGGCDLWQRFAYETFPKTANNDYTADRWRIFKNAGSTISVTREGTTKKANSLYALNANCTVFAVICQVTQRLVIADGYHHLLGQRISTAADVWSNTAAAVALRLETDGTGALGVSSTAHPGGSVFAELKIENQLVPTDATAIIVGLNFTAAAQVYLDNAMVVLGPLALPYAALSPADELARAMRYYEVQGGVTDFPHVSGYTTVINDNIRASLPWAVPKGGTPTVSKLGTWNVSASTNQPTVEGASPTGYTLAAQVTAGGVGLSRARPNSADDVIIGEWNP